jgi:protein-tyrosine phosphatase
VNPSGTTWPSGRSRDGGIDQVPYPGAGALWLCGKHVVGPDPDGALARARASLIVCLNERDELEDRYPDYVRWLEREQVPGGRALWRPIHDLSAPPLEGFVALTDEVGQRLDAGATVLVHCGAGIGRAGTLAVGLLVRAGAELDEALALVASHRPMAGPEVGAQRDVVHAHAVRLGRSTS